MEAMYQGDTTQQKRQSYNALNRPIPQLAEELKSLYPGLRAFTINNVELQNFDSKKTDTVTMVVINTRTVLNVNDQNRLRSWLKNRTNADSLVLVVQK